jgi:hypothetical protein
MGGVGGVVEGLAVVLVPAEVIYNKGMRRDVKAPFEVYPFILFLWVIIKLINYAIIKHSRFFFSGHS